MSVLNIRQAASYLGIGVDTLYLICEGKRKEKIPCFKIGNRWKFETIALDRWIKECITEHMKTPSGQNGYVVDSKGQRSMDTAKKGC